MNQEVVIRNRKTSEILADVLTSGQSLWQPMHEAYEAWHMSRENAVRIAEELLAKDKETELQILPLDYQSVVSALQTVAGLLEYYENEHSEGACECRPEPENEGHLCYCCRARLLLKDSTI